MQLINTLAVMAAPSLNSEGLVEWGVKTLIPIVLLFVGIGIIDRVRKGQMSQDALTVSNLMLGCVVIGAAATVYGFADKLAAFAFTG